jgi:large subunit ribosomal protein L29
LKINDIHSMNDQELAKKLDEKHHELFDLRFKSATKQLKNHRQIPPVKKDLARLKTVKRQRELGMKQG